MPEFKAVKIDETRHWNEKFREKFGITEMVGVYVFNPNEATHCCELTPSYELLFVHTQSDWDIELNEDEREEMYDGINDSDTDQDSIYMHCSSVDRMETVDIGEFEDEYEAIEYCHGNWI
ncbi:MAG: hypothetical protein ACTSW7_00595 [Candidatus Thorarchaeota archaeon]|nr:MAG: hypothetical protein DRP42_02860 [Mycoplasmatota bacterium]HEC72599.1 hypothetical protein [Thermoplasmatales archaeon]